jgi:outer membrane receptor protein involved in Fe transport
MTTCYPLALLSRRLLLGFFLLIILHALQVAAFAQSSTATLSGTVTDANNAVVPGAHVTATNNGTGLKREATTSGSGTFVIPLLPPSTYTVLVENQGFTPAEIKDVTLNVGDNVALNIQLKVGQVGATVDVKSDVALINESSAVATVVDRQFVANLPLNGRSFQTLIQLTPGVVLTNSTAGEAGQFSVNGQRSNSNYFSVDGVSAGAGVGTTASLGQGGAGTVPGLAITGGTNNLVSVDALQEFTVQTSGYAAESGRQPGAQVSIVTRSGTNQFHGTGFDYFRNDKLDANDWFANSRAVARGAERQNDFGGVLGGPLPLPRFGEGGSSFLSGKNRTFFFFSYEGLRLRLPTFVIGRTLSLATRASAVASVQPLVAAFPLPNGPDLLDSTGKPTGVAEFHRGYSNATTLDATSLRIDQTFNHNTLFGRFNKSPSYATSLAGAASLTTIQNTYLNTTTLTLGDTWTIRNSILNELRFNYSKFNGGGKAFLDNVGGAVAVPDSVIFPSFASSNDSQIVIILNPGSPSFIVGRVADNYQRQTNLVDNFTVLNGSHALKFGVDYRRLAPSAGPQKYLQQTLITVSTGIASFVLVQAADPSALLFTNLSLYAQDTWKVKPRLTLTLGLRWELNPPPTGRGGTVLYTVNNLDNPAAITLAPPGTPLYSTPYHDFAPRIGVAYKVFSKQNWQTMLRGGYGIFYDLVAGQIGQSPSLWPYTRSTNLFNVSYPLSPALAAPPPFSLAPPIFRASVLQRNLDMPRTHQWNVTLEQELGAGQTLTLSYVAAIGRGLLRTQRLIGPNPNVNFLSITRNGGTSDYHALQVQFQRRLAKGLQALASYTWSHAIDDASGEAALFAPDEAIPASLERGNSAFDVRHNFIAAVTYNLPTPGIGYLGKAIFGHWSIDAIFRAHTGTPIDVNTGNSFFGSNTASRPNIVPGVPFYIDDPTAPGGVRLNKLAFSTVTGRQGNLGRNALRGHSLWQSDLALRREMKIKEPLSLQISAELFNLFNHPNFANENATLNAGNFGVSTAMLSNGLTGLSSRYQIGGPRSAQLALKLIF